MTETFEPKNQFDIQVALKIIRHISSGIYRDRAGSLRELISNSFDAQAKVVAVDTGYPKHDTIVVTDDGMGFDEQTLRKSFTQVGLSLKVQNPEMYQSDLKRPIIGRFGIGFLAAAHISHDIWIWSYPKESDHGIEVQIDLKPYFLYQDKVETFDEFKFGSVKYREIPKRNNEKGTRVELRGVSKSNFHRVLTQDADEKFVTWPKRGYREENPGHEMRQLVERTQRRVNLLYVDRLEGREQILWHLGMTAPVRYLDGGPIRPGHTDAESAKVIQELKEFNEKLNFQLWMDGVEIRKPILLPTYHVGGGKVEDPDLPKDILVSPVMVSGKSERGKPVHAKGYLFYQPYRIVPAELRGLYPRMAGVGIGYTYENKFLSYLKAESPILRVQVSGEIYVLNGLDEALNLDRSGFMEIDPEYSYLAEEAGRQVTEFFHKAKKAHGQRENAKKAREAATTREKWTKRLRAHAKNLGFTGEVSVRPEKSPKSPTPDFSNVSLYAVGPASDLVVDTRQKRITLFSEVSDDVFLAELALTVDQLLNKHAKDPTAAKREFAKLLQSLVEELEE